jgi:FMN-dependent NADH-azoreductase
MIAVFLEKLQAKKPKNDFKMNNFLSHCISNFDSEIITDLFKSGGEGCGIWAS